MCWGMERNRLGNKPGQLFFHFHFRGQGHMDNVGEGWEGVKGRGLKF